MKKTFNKIKVCLTAFRIALISFPLKVKGVKGGEWANPQPDYGIYYPSEKILPSPVEQTATIVDIIIKIAPRLLMALTFIIGVISFVKIRKINDKELKKKKTEKIIIIISLLIILIIVALLLTLFLKKYW